jgi:hypothetical protein
MKKLIRQLSSWAANLAVEQLTRLLISWRAAKRLIWRSPTCFLSVVFGFVDDCSINISRFRIHQYYEHDHHVTLFLLTYEITSESNQIVLNINITDVIDSSTKRKILEMFVEQNNVQKTTIKRNDDVQRTLRIENDSQFLIKFKRKKNSTIMSADVIAMNIKSRKMHMQLH